MVFAASVDVSVLLAFFGVDSSIAGGISGVFTVVFFWTSGAGIG